MDHFERLNHKIWRFFISGIGFKTKFIKQVAQMYQTECQMPSWREQNTSSLYITVEFKRSSSFVVIAAPLASRQLLDDYASKDDNVLCI